MAARLGFMSAGDPNILEHSEYPLRYRLDGPMHFSRGDKTCARMTEIPNLQALKHRAFS